MNLSGCATASKSSVFARSRSLRPATPAGWCWPRRVTRPDGGAPLQAWHRDTRPVTIGERISVCYAWSEHERSQLEELIELGPGGFGSGHHPTTRQIVEELVNRIGGGERVLDVGCGSGILGLCALRLGAARVLAVDLKPDAVAAARRNARANGMACRMEATLAALGRIDGVFDVVLANIARAAGSRWVGSRRRSAPRRSTSCTR